MNTDLNKIKNRLLNIEELKKYKIFLFWSRAKWTHRVDSDYDIWIIWEEELKFETYLNIKKQLSDLPYQIDLVDFSKASDYLVKTLLKDIIYLK